MSYLRILNENTVIVILDDNDQTECHPYNLLVGFKDHRNFDEAQCSMETLFLLTTAVPPDFILQAKGVAHLYWYVSLACKNYGSSAC